MPADPLDLLRDDLDQWEPSDPSDEPEDAPPPEDPLGADRLLRRIQRNARELDRLQKIARAEQERIAAWLADRSSGLISSTEFAERNLEQWMRSNYERTGHKTENLPHGVLRLTQPGAPSVVVTDEGEFITWCLSDDERDGFLRRTVAADKAEVRRALKVGPADETQGDGDDAVAVFFAVDASGEVVPGLRFTKPALARFSVTHPAQNADSPDKETAE